MTMGASRHEKIMLREAPEHTERNLEPNPTLQNDQFTVLQIDVTM
jgi:hypothetical protein